jgi:hypothetical protein
MESRVLLSFGLCIALAGLASGQSSPWITMSQVMTGDQLRKTGVEGLTPAQRGALDQWLSEYTSRVVQLAQDSPKPTNPVSGGYAGSSGGHWVKSKVDNGAMVILEDGSIWEINSLDRINTALWLPITNVTVLKAGAPVGDYKYTLINTDDGEKALAKYLGKQ